MSRVHTVSALRRKPFRVHYIRRMLRRFPKMRAERLAVHGAGPGVDGICQSGWADRAMRYGVVEQMKRGADTGRYILGGPDGHQSISCRNLWKWSHWFETADRHVRLTRVGPVRVSTVFLGLDHDFSRSATEKPDPNYQPRIFETMCSIDMAHEATITKADGSTMSFDSPLTFLDEQTRCRTWDDAVLMHYAMVEKVKQPGDEVEELLPE